MPAAAAATDAPEKGLTPNDRLLASRLNPEQAKIFRERKAKSLKEVIKEVGGEGKPGEKPDGLKPGANKPETAPGAAASADAGKENKGGQTAEEIRFGEETPEEGKGGAPAEEEPVELSEEELAKLDEKVRKRVADASKENVKVRKRAQEAEAKNKEHEAALAAKDEELKALREGVTRGVGLSGNAFAQFKDANAVAAWGTNAQEALVLLKNHERAVKAGRAGADDTITHTLPNGQEVELRAADRAAYEARANDAQAWFEHGEKFAANQKAAAKLVEKHEGTKGYKEAREKYLKDPGLSARMDELVAKAALYDMLESRKAVITFSDAAGAARNAPSEPAGGDLKKTPQKQPPSESPASVPRLVKTDDAGDDLKARKSALMERARTAPTEGERQKLLKEAIMLGNPQARQAKKRA